MASPHPSAYVHAYMDGLIPWETSILGYSDSTASLCRPGTDAMVARGSLPPPSDDYILPCAPAPRRVPYYSFPRIMTSRPGGAIISPGRDGGHREIGRASSPTDGGPLGAESPGGLGLTSGGPHIFWQPEVWLTTALPAMATVPPRDRIRGGLSIYQCGDTQ